MRNEPYYGDEHDSTAHALIASLLCPAKSAFVVMLWRCGTWK